jgi:hypothetical protein
MIKSIQLAIIQAFTALLEIQIEQMVVILDFVSTSLLIVLMFMDESLYATIKVFPTEISH